MKKLLRHRIDGIKRDLRNSDKLKKFVPAINAFDTFLFVPNVTTRSGAHIRDAVDTKRTMITVVIALVPALLFGMWNTGYQHFSQLGEQVSILEAFWFGFGRIFPMIAVFICRWFDHRIWICCIPRT